MKISVIVSTYNAEEWLEKVLLGYMQQSHADYEVIVADDGSRASTRELIQAHASRYPVPLRHLWHEDQGYRRQEILNRAIPLADAPYILFTDGDCIPRRDFVETHARLAEPGRFLSGGYCKLNMTQSKQIDADDIASGRCFEPAWLRRHGPLGFSNSLKLGGVASELLDAITPTRPTFNNCNSSAWKQDLLDINGYDERMKYGGPDRELGERLENHGVRGKQIRHRALCVHLDHSRGYKTRESVDRNLAIREETRKSRLVFTPHGIRKEMPGP